MSRPHPVLLLAASLSVLVTMGFPPPASARAPELWDVPTAATITLTGHGFGHGHGLSQYGAEGAARAGLTYRQIIDFYYPGTTWSTLGGTIQVLLTGDTTNDVQVVAQPDMKVRSLASRRTWSVPANGARRWRMVGLAGGKTQVQFRKTGGWRTWKRFAGDGEFSARTGRLGLVTPGATKTYRGRLRSASARPGRAARDTVNVLSMESYLRGVVPLEIPALWSPDAVAAQAVAARTYAAAERSHPNASHYEICDTTQCQVYGGYDAEHPAATAAVKATAKQVLTYDGRPAFTQFSASSGGWTSAGSAPYLVAQEDPYDGWEGNKVHTWTVDLPDTAIEKHWPDMGDLTRIEVLARDGNGEWGGRVQDMALTFTGGTVTTTGDTLRTYLGLRSTWFTVAVAPTPARPRG